MYFIDYMMHSLYVMQLMIMCRTLEAMKVAFRGFSKSDFRFPKFHLTTHYVDVILEFGSLRIVDSGSGERNHKKGVKAYFFRTSKKKSLAQAQMANIFRASEAVQQLSEVYGIDLDDASDLYVDTAVALHHNRSSVDKELDPTVPLDDARYTHKFIGTGRKINLRNPAERVPLWLQYQPNGVPDDSHREAYDYFIEELVATFEFADVTELLQEFNSPTLYTSCLITHGTKRVTVRAKSNYEIGSWYDHVAVEVAEDGGDVEYACQVIWFVHLPARDEEDNLPSPTYALVKYKTNALRSREVVVLSDDGETFTDLRSRHKELKLPCVHADPSVQARYGLINTRQIKRLLWLEADQDVPARSWVIDLTTLTMDCFK